jgi:DNA polymerase III gamma/tau subunit
MVGLLSKIATDNKIPYDLDGLDVIARHAKGIIRDAVQWLNTAAALGEIKPDSVKAVIDTSLEDKCLKLLLTIAKKDQIAAVKLADEIGLNFLPQKIVETLLSLYARSIWQEDPDSDIRQIYMGLPNVGEVTDTLIKWSGLAVPADVLPIIVFELLQTQQVKQTGRPVLAPVVPTARKPIAIPVVSKNPLAAFLDDEVV